jgi:hypothetical protein
LGLEIPVDCLRATPPRRIVLVRKPAQTNDLLAQHAAAADPPRSVALAADLWNVKRLVEKVTGQRRVSVAAFVGIGMAIGAGAGAALKNVALGVNVGAAVGLAIGYALRGRRNA